MRRLVALTALAVLPAAAPAQPAVVDSAAESIDFGRRDPTELPLKLPGAPQAGNLLRFDVTPSRGFQYFIDRESLTVGSDGIVRFTAIVKSDTGGQNVFYEGIRCRPAERKVFAYGRPDGGWTEPSEPKWVHITTPTADGYRFALYENYFCPARQAIKTAAEGVAALRRGGHPRAKDDASLANQPFPR